MQTNRLIILIALTSLWAMQVPLMFIYLIERNLPEMFSSVVGMLLMGYMVDKIYTLFVSNK